MSSKIIDIVSFLFITYNYSIYAYSLLQIESIRALSTILYHKKSQILGLLNDVVSSVYASEQVGKWPPERVNSLRPESPKGAIQV